MGFSISQTLDVAFSSASTQKRRKRRTIRKTCIQDNVPCPLHRRSNNSRPSIGFHPQLPIYFLFCLRIPLRGSWDLLLTRGKICQRDHLEFPTTSFDFSQFALPLSLLSFLLQDFFADSANSSRLGRGAESRTLSPPKNEVCIINIFLSSIGMFRLSREIGSLKFLRE